VKELKITLISSKEVNVIEEATKFGNQIKRVQETKFKDSK